MQCRECNMGAARAAACSSAAATATAPAAVSAVQRTLSLRWVALELEINCRPPANCFLSSQAQWEPRAQHGPLPLPVNGPLLLAPLAARRGPLLEN